MDGEQATRKVGGIPIRNLYVMLAFAGSLRTGLGEASCGAIDGDALPLDLLARLLSEKLAWMRSHATPRNYRVRDEVGTRPEGALDLATTLRGMHLVHRRVAYQIDELQLDTPHNRLICAGVRVLIRSPQVTSSVRDELRRQLAAFAGVSYVTQHDALRIDWTLRERGQAYYAEALGLARLALLETLPDEHERDAHWRKLLDDHERMGELFEEFVRGFLGIQFAGLGNVTKPHFHWSSTPHPLQPQLHTDLMIERHADPGLTIGECKLYRSPLMPGRNGGQRLRPAHLNQLFAYLCAAATRYPARPIEGMLIYALVDEPFDGELMLRDFRVRIHAIDLRLPWKDLRQQLMRLWPAHERRAYDEPHARGEDVG